MLVKLFSRDQTLHLYPYACVTCIDGEWALEFGWLHWGIEFSPGDDPI